ncbi:FecR family protein [Mucilaginibacter segetis]|uniref:FecR family protein n=1 Tax=Mucilaginibacter segetis TaxID=2793071 RepID=A0A934PVL2_9SPHI|nr:FecR family protein [Mucilaginibacter segetis]MBK0379910.1 FecR family protein [Mucilaginibacter segetis]
MNPAEKLANAIDNYLKGTATPEETSMVNEWYYSFNDEEVNIPAQFKVLHSRIEERLKNRIYASTGIKVNHVKPFYQTKTARFAVAASILLFISVGLYFKLKTAAVDKTNPAQVAANDVKPGGNNAVLTLANGEKINLTSTKVGYITQQVGSKLSKTKDGLLTYNASGSVAHDSPISYNTIETPNGGQYQVNLPDGTKVWLNAASYLKYPVQFTGSTREVELKGEGYFEVAKDKSKPFRVITDKQTIQVLGTHFNINSYADEQYVTTTLLEGSVKVLPQKPDRGNKAALLLKPGEQALIDDHTAQVKAVNVDNFVAWKNGNFIFDGEDLHSIMRKISRWYDVKIEYKYNPKDALFTGIVSRAKSLTTLLHALEATGKVRFKISAEQKLTTVYSPVDNNSN